MKKGMILLILSSFLLVGCDSIKMDKLAANNNERVNTLMELRMNKILK